MAQITSSNDIQVLKIRQFLGLNENPDGDTKIKNGEMSKMRNFRVTREKHLQIRPGTKTVLNLKTAWDAWCAESGHTAPTANPVFSGAWEGVVDSKQRTLAAFGGLIFSLDPAAATTKVVGQCTQAQTSFFGFSNKVYLLNGHEYMSWDGKDNSSFTAVEGYIPTVMNATTPAGGGFLLENVNMKKEHLRVITEYVGVFPVRINSALVSAQNRDRWYWTNIRTRQEGLFGELYSDIPQPTDRRILLRDILENEVSGKYYLNDNMLNWLKKHAAKQGTSIKIKLCNDKIGCLTSAQFKMNLSSDYVLQLPHGKSRGGVHVNKTPTLSANAWEQNNLMIQLNRNKEFGTQPRQQNRIYFQYGKSPALAAGHGGQTSNVLDDVRVRRLTPLECARLQTVPDWYRWRCSDTQIYRMLGNGWTVEVIMHILSFWNRINRERQRLCGDLKEK